jgi:hypothetical protein
MEIAEPQGRRTWRNKRCLMPKQPLPKGFPGEDLHQGGFPRAVFTDKALTPL